MPEEILFKMEKRMANTEIADYLRTIADRLDAREPITLKSGEQSVELTTDRDTVFEVKVEREGREESLELELEWEQGQKGSDNDLAIK